MATPAGSVQISWISLNPDKFSQIFRVRVKWAPPVCIPQSLHIKPKAFTHVLTNSTHGHINTVTPSVHRIAVDKFILVHNAADLIMILSTCSKQHR